jgi:CRISPR/Cas system-associated endoribonuclease Cas2
LARGTDVIIYKIFLAEKFVDKIGAFCSNYCQFLQKYDYVYGLKSRHRRKLAKNCRKLAKKSPKIVVITSTPVLFESVLLFCVKNLF